MKKKLLVLTAALFMTFSATFANNPDPVPGTVVTGLHQQFTGATDVQWKTTDNFYKASFTLDGQHMDAFYSFEGRLISLSRKIAVEQLPLFLLKDVKEMTAKYTVFDLFELLSDKGTEYFITLKNDKETKVFQSAGDGWSRY